MTSIIRSDLVISGTYKLTDATQVATGVKITVLPGATLDFGGFSLLNYGTLSLEGNASTFAVLQNGTYSTDSTSGVLKTSYGNLKSVVVDGFFSHGTLQLTDSLIENSTIDALQSSSISKSIFIKSPLDFGIEYGTVDQVTFSDSKVSASAWPMLDTARLAISNSNFVGATPVIYLSPFFAGNSHGIKITNSFILIPTGSNFESMVYDANDDLKVITDLDATTFLTTPIANNSNGFTVGPYTFPLNLLQNVSAPADTTAPTLTTFSPADEAMGVALASNINLTFSEAIAIGTGVIILKTAAGATVATFDAATSNNLSISGNALTINPSADLAYNTGYKVEFAAGTIKDLAGNSYAGTSSYNFTTLQNYIGTNANESFTSGSANDTIDGGAGTDIAVYSSSRTNYILTKTASGWSVSSSVDGTDSLQNVERLQFTDKKLALDLSPNGHGGQALEFIGLMAPALVNTPSIVGLILGLFDQGKSLHDVCQLALDVGLVNSTAGSGTNAALAAMAFRNLIGSEADAGVVEMLVGYMDGRFASYSQADFMTVIAGLDLNQAHIGLVGLQQTGVEYI